MSWFDMTHGPAFLAQASTTERQPPPGLAHRLAASDGGQEMPSALVRRLLHLEPSPANGLHTTQRQLVELGITALLGWHLDKSELTAARLASAYLGANIAGFEGGASADFNTPLGSLSGDQLAELVVLERVPVASRERIRRVKKRLLDRSACGLATRSTGPATSGTVSLCSRRLPPQVGWLEDWAS